MSRVLIVAAVICFVLATIGVGASIPLIPLGLALWCGSSLA